MNSYFPYHVHTDLSNCVTNIDSVTNFKEYIGRAAECDMSGIAFAEHGNVFNHSAKRDAATAAGLRFVHACEAYITMKPGEKFRDNYHAVLIAKNYDGFLELNRLVSVAFTRADNHFYYTPRIYMEDLEKTSDNIIVTSACLGGALNSESEDDRKRFLSFMMRNKNRCFLEIQHHLIPDQLNYNQYIAELSSRYGIKMIAGTDTHALNAEQLAGRKMLQLGKGVKFASEEDWNMEFLTFDELCGYYRKQNPMPEVKWMEAIDNTNLVLSMCEDYELDHSIKYPNVFENPDEKLREVVYQYATTHPYASKRYTMEEMKPVIEMELDAFKKTGQASYLLLLDHLCKWEREHGEHTGYGRGSITGSFCSYLMGVTKTDPIKYNLNFFRYCSPERVTVADCDVDHSEHDRALSKEYILRDHLGFKTVQSAEIITYNTIAVKGAVKDIGRALNMPLDEVQAINNSIEGDDVPESLRKKYLELFKWVDIVKGTVVSYGTHACGTLVTDHDIDSEIGSCTSSTSNYKITALDMSDLDHLNLVKWDLLGLATLGLINSTCELAGIDRVEPDSLECEDDAVWEDIREDNTTLFQFESSSAGAYLRKLFSDENMAKMKAEDKNFSRLDLLTLASALLRPGCASFRDYVADGKLGDSGCEALNEFLKPERGFLVYQETIMRWLQLFCGYTAGESDVVRRAIAKKKGTETLLPEIERRFVEYAPQHYNLTTEEAERTIKPFIQSIMDASSYSFSRNHSLAYAFTTYAEAWLRHYYPLEFIASALNIWGGDDEKTSKIMEYASRHGVSIMKPAFGKAKAEYFIDREMNSVIKGTAAIKTLNAEISDALYELSQTKHFDYFSDLIIATKEIGLRSNQLEALIETDYFSAYGNARKLSNIRDFVEFMKYGEAKSVKKDRAGSYEQFIAPHSTDQTKSGKPAASYTITDMTAVLHSWEDYQTKLAPPDLSLTEKCALSKKHLGYVDITTGRREDKGLCLVNSKVFPLKSKKNGKVWAYAADFKSIGTGKTVRASVVAGFYNHEPFKEGDIVRILNMSFEKNQYWTVTKYEVQL